MYPRNEESQFDEKDESFGDSSLLKMKEAFFENRFSAMESSSSKIFFWVIFFFFNLNIELKRIDLSLHWNIVYKRTGFELWIFFFFLKTSLEN